MTIMTRRFIILILLLLLLAGAGIAGAKDRLRDFTSDGCTLFPDGSPAERRLWCDCCFLHDISYWQGGTAEERLHADEAFRTCVKERTGSNALAAMMFDGVRFGGHPVFPNWYRWGYGWRYGRGYAPLTDAERLEVAGRLEQYFREHAGGYCREREIKDRDLQQKEVVPVSKDVVSAGSGSHSNEGPR